MPWLHGQHAPSVSVLSEGNAMKTWAMCLNLDMALMAMSYQWANISHLTSALTLSEGKVGWAICLGLVWRHKQYRWDFCSPSLWVFPKSMPWHLKQGKPSGFVGTDSVQAHSAGMLVKKTVACLTDWLGVEIMSTTALTTAMPSDILETTTTTPVSPTTNTGANITKTPNNNPVESPCQETRQC